MGNPSLSSHNQFTQTLLMRSPTMAFQRAQAAIKNPEEDFAIAMRKTFVEDDCRLPIPYEHADRFLRSFRDRHIILFYDHENWHCVLKFNQNQYKLGAGWRDFVVSNGIGKYDAVLFRRMYGLDEETLYQVNIFKA